VVLYYFICFLFCFFYVSCLNVCRYLREEELARVFGSKCHHNNRFLSRIKHR
jgi:hypothetical protein